MSDKQRILLQLDRDEHASSFDAVVAIDAGVEHLLQYHHVEPAGVRDLVHGAIFTRGPRDLRHTAIFLGGRDVAAAEQLLAHVTDCFFGPMRVSVMMDANGSNTTAAAAVLAAAAHVELAAAEVLVLAATGPVGQRVVRLLAAEGAAVRVASRSADRARHVCDKLQAGSAGGRLTPVAPRSTDELGEALRGVQVVIAAGAAGVELLPAAVREQASGLRVAIDLNAVPPLGIGGIEVTDRAEPRQDTVCYGAVGVGATKMKIHKAAIRQLFTANDLVLDAEQMLEIGRAL